MDGAGAWSTGSTAGVRRFSLSVGISSPFYRSSSHTKGPRRHSCQMIRMLTLLDFEVDCWVVQVLGPQDQLPVCGDSLSVEYFSTISTCTMSLTLSTTMLFPTMDICPTGDDGSQSKNMDGLLSSGVFRG